MLERLSKRIIVAIMIAVLTVGVSVPASAMVCPPIYGNSLCY